MRINIITTKGDGTCGIGTYTKYLSEEQKKFNYIIHFYWIKLNDKNPLHYFKIFYNVIKKCDIIHIQFDYSLFGKFLGLTGIWAFFFFPLVKITAKLKKIKIIITMHEIWNYKNSPKYGYIGSIYVFLLNFLISVCVDKIIFLSENGYNIGLNQKIPITKMVQIPHGLKDSDKFDKKISRKQLKLDPEKKIILQFGFISRSKGQDLLVKATQYLPKDWIFLIAGSCKNQEDMEYLENDCKKYSPENLIFLNFISEEDIPILFSSIDLVILPYREIIQSGVLNLAFSYKIPVIASDLPYFEEINNEYHCLVLFKKDNEISLAKAIYKTLSNENLYSSIVNNIQKYYEQNSYNLTALRINKIYQELLEMT